MICFVTGASGFVGANLVHELEAQGHTVKLLLRPNADLRGHEGAQYEFVEGDLSNRKFLAEAMRVLGLVQRFGFGIPVARRELREKDHPDPTFLVEPTRIQCTVWARR